MFQSIREPQIRVSTANEEIAHSGGGDLNAVLLAELRRYLFPCCSGSSQRADVSLNALCDRSVLSKPEGFGKTPEEFAGRRPLLQTR
jgi:hypothetical protein